MPNFRYQRLLAGPVVEHGIRTKAQIRQFLKGMYGGAGPKGERLFSIDRGLLIENLDGLGPSPLMNDEVASSRVRAIDHWHR